MVRTRAQVPHDPSETKGGDHYTHRCTNQVTVAWSVCVKRLCNEVYTQYYRHYHKSDAPVAQDNLIWGLPVDDFDPDRLEERIAKSRATFEAEVA
jgi:hypothetical protein